MAILILILAVVLIIGLVQKSRTTRARDTFNKLSESEKRKVVAERKRNENASDELITVILPTINHDK